MPQRFVTVMSSSQMTRLPELHILGLKNLIKCLIISWEHIPYETCKNAAIDSLAFVHY